MFSGFIFYLFHFPWWLCRNLESDRSQKQNIFVQSSYCRRRLQSYCPRKGREVASSKPSCHEDHIDREVHSTLIPILHFCPRLVTHSWVDMSVSTNTNAHDWGQLTNHKPKSYLWHMSTLSLVCQSKFMVAVEDSTNRVPELFIDSVITLLDIGIDYLSTYSGLLSLREGFKKKKYGKFHIGSWPPPLVMEKIFLFFFLKLDHFFENFL